MRKLLDARITQAYDRLMLLSSLRQAARISVIGFILAIVGLLLIAPPGKGLPPFVSIPAYMAVLLAGMAWTAMSA